jgi:hypothetical protein
LTNQILSVKDYKPPKPEKEFKSAKLHQCGHVVTYGVGSERRFEKCETLTSKKVKLKDGRSIYLCPTHAFDPAKNL